MLTEIENLCSCAESSLNAVNKKELHGKPALAAVLLPLLEECCNLGMKLQGYEASPLS